MAVPGWASGSEACFDKAIHGIEVGAPVDVGTLMAARGLGDTV